MMKFKWKHALAALLAAVMMLSVWAAHSRTTSLQQRPVRMQALMWILLATAIKLR